MKKQFLTLMLLIILKPFSGSSQTIGTMAKDLPPYFSIQAYSGLYPDIYIMPLLINNL
jgi:hypothetical protein